MAFTYDLVSRVVSLGAWRCWTRTALKHIGQDSPVLELAHGTGNLQIDLFAAGYRPIGYDLSAAMGRIAQHKLREQGLSPRLARGRAQQLPFVSGSFAAVDQHVSDRFHQRAGNVARSLSRAQAGRRIRDCAECAADRRRSGRSRRLNGSTGSPGSGLAVGIMPTEMRWGRCLRRFRSRFSRSAARAASSR